jgi:hypothetical protein
MQDTIQSLHVRADSSFSRADPAPGDRWEAADGSHEEKVHRSRSSRCSSLARQEWAWRLCSKSQWPQITAEHVSIIRALIGFISTTEKNTGMSAKNWSFLRSHPRQPPITQYSNDSRLTRNGRRYAQKKCHSIRWKRRRPDSEICIRRPATNKLLTRMRKCHSRSRSLRRRNGSCLACYLPETSLGYRLAKSLLARKREHMELRSDLCKLMP